MTEPQLRKAESRAWQAAVKLFKSKNPKRWPFGLCDYATVRMREGEVQDRMLDRLDSWGSRHNKLWCNYWWPRTKRGNKSRITRAKRFAQDALEGEPQ